MRGGPQEASSPAPNLQGRSTTDCRHGPKTCGAAPAPGTSSLRGAHLRHQQPGRLCTLLTRAKLSAHQLLPCRALRQIELRAGRSCVVQGEPGALDVCVAVESDAKQACGHPADEPMERRSGRTHRSSNLRRTLPSQPLDGLQTNSLPAPRLCQWSGILRVASHRCTRPAPRPCPLPSPCHNPAL